MLPMNREMFANRFMNCPPVTVLRQDDLTQAGVAIRNGPRRKKRCRFDRGKLGLGTQPTIGHGRPAGPVEIVDDVRGYQRKTRRQRETRQSLLERISFPVRRCLIPLKVLPSFGTALSPRYPVASRNAEDLEGSIDFRACSLPN